MPDPFKQERDRARIFLNGDHIKTPHCQRQAGFSLLEMLITVGIASVLAAGMATVIVRSVSGMKHVELRGDLESIRSTLRDSLDCQATFAEAGIDPDNPSMCATTSDTQQKGPYLWLRRYTKDGSVIHLTNKPNTNGFARLGSWDLRASCSATRKSLVIQAVRVKPDGTYANDPLTGQPLKPDTKASILFGGDIGTGSNPAVSVPICYGKGELTGEIVVGKRQFLWNGSKLVAQAIVTDPPMASAVQSYQTPAVTLPSPPWDGLACNQSLGWKPISCHVNTVGFQISDGIMRKVAQEPTSGKVVSFSYDLDAWIDPSHNGCLTNSVANLSSPTRPPTELVAGKSGMSLHVVCVKVGN